MCRIPVRSPIPSSPESSRARFDAFEAVVLIFLMILPGILAVFIALLLANIQEAPESPRSRQVILDVPETSRVDAQVTSGNNTVNLQNL